jgi:hypothetical protein
MNNYTEQGKPPPRGRRPEMIDDIIRLLEPGTTPRLLNIDRTVETPQPMEGNHATNLTASRNDRARAI